MATDSDTSAPVSSSTLPRPANLGLAQRLASPTVPRLAKESMGQPRESTGHPPVPTLCNKLQYRSAKARAQFGSHLIGEHFHPSEGESRNGSREPPPGAAVGCTSPVYLGGGFVGSERSRLPGRLHARAEVADARRAPFSNGLLSRSARLLLGFFGGREGRCRA